MDKPFLHKGHRFDGPGGQAYELARDVYEGDFHVASDFVAIGGAPEPVEGMLMPDWLSIQIRPLVG